MNKTIKLISLLMVIILLGIVAFTPEAHAATSKNSFTYYSASAVLKRADVNKDGQLNITDIANILNKMRTTNSKYDVDGDGIVTSYDVYVVRCIMMAKYPVGDLNKNHILDIYDFTKYKANYEALDADRDLLNEKGFFNGEKDKSSITSIRNAYKKAIKQNLKGLKLKDNTYNNLKTLDINLDKHISYADYNLINVITHRQTENFLNQKLYKNYDLNGNGKYDNGDFSTMRWSFSSPETQSNMFTFYSLNKDNKITYRDYQMIYFKKNGRLDKNCAKEVVGDINLDGKRNVTDIAKISAHLKYIKALTPFEQQLADINRDGVINGTDLSLIQGYIKGQNANYFASDL